MSTWIKSNGEGDKWLWLTKGNLFCFAKGHTLHTESVLLIEEAVGITWERKDILEIEGWPNLQCQMWKELWDCLTELRLYKTLVKSA